MDVIFFTRYWSESRLPLRCKYWLSRSIDDFSALCFAPHQLKGETVQMTNQEWYDFIYPDNDDLPYMYNDFTWDHCA